MAQLNDNEMEDSLERFQHQITIEQLKCENNQLKFANDQFKRENETLKREVDQLKYANDQLKQDNDRRFNSLKGEVANLKSRILDCIRPANTSEHVNKRICLNQTNETEQITDDYSQVDANNIDFSSLPDDAINLILIRLPLRHRVLLRIICHRWKSIIELMCKSVHLLKLFGPTIKSLNYNKEKDKSKHNLLLIDMKRKVEAPKFLITQLKFIPKLFSNVDQLVLNFPKTFEFTIMLLLESWTDRLTSLTLDIEVSDKFLGEAIWNLIAQLPKLASFRYNDFMHRFNSENCQLDFMGKLRDLQIRSLVNGDYIIGFIGPNIRRLEMKTGYHSFFGGFENRPTKLSNLTHLNLTIIVYQQSAPELQQKMLQFICGHFVSLTELDFDCLYQLPFDEQLIQMGKLFHLTKLRLCMTGENLNRDLPHSIQFTKLRSLVLDISIKPMTPKQTQLKPVNIIQRSRIVNFLNEIPRMFPVLVKLKIVARIKLTVKIIEQLVNDSALKSCERVKCKLIEKLK